MRIWLLIVSYWTTNQKPFLVQILIYENGIRKQILREDEKKGQEETQDCQSISSRPEPIQTTFRHYKNLKSQTLETLVLL